MAVVIESLEKEHFFVYSGVHDHNIFAACALVSRRRVRIPSWKTDSSRRLTS